MSTLHRSGRKKDPIWIHFIEKSNKTEGKLGNRAICKKCRHEMQGLVERMKVHWQKCSETNTEIEKDNESVVSTQTAYYNKIISK